MTREEQIKQASFEFAFKASSIRPELNADSFIQGAMWADKTMVDKACEWFEYVDFEMTYIDSEGLFDKEQFINNFKRAMEE